MKPFRLLPDFSLTERGRMRRDAPYEAHRLLVRAASGTSGCRRAQAERKALTTAALKAATIVQARWPEPSI